MPANYLRKLLKQTAAILQSVLGVLILVWFDLGLFQSQTSYSEQKRLAKAAGTRKEADMLLRKFINQIGFIYINIAAFDYFFKGLNTDGVSHLQHLLPESLHPAKLFWDKQLKSFT